MNDWNTEIQFPNDQAEIERAVQKADAHFDALLKTPVPLVLRISQIFGASIPYGKPDLKKLPASVRQDVQELGFKPCCNMLWGHWPLPFMSTPQWIGPEGFTKLESYFGKHFYLATLFADGTAISMTNRREGGSNTMTEYQIASGDFKKDYRDHLEAVRRHMENGSVQPIYASTSALLRRRYAVFYRLHMSPASALTALSTQSSMLLAAAFVIHFLLA